MWMTFSSGLSGELELDTRPHRDLVRGHPDHGAYDAVHVHRLDGLFRAVRQQREITEHVADAAHPFHARVDRVQRLVPCVRPLLDQRPHVLQVGQHVGRGVVHLVGHALGELRERGELVGGGELGLCLPDLLFAIPELTLRHERGDDPQKRRQSVRVGAVVGAGRSGVQSDDADQCAMRDEWQIPGAPHAIAERDALAGQQRRQAGFVEGLRALEACPEPGARGGPGLWGERVRSETADSCRLDYVQLGLVDRHRAPKHLPEVIAELAVVQRPIGPRCFREGRRHFRGT
jgi:hypothetical protein